MRWTCNLCEVSWYADTPDDAPSLAELFDHAEDRHGGVTLQRTWTSSGEYVEDDRLTFDAGDDGDPNVRHKYREMAGTVQRHGTGDTYPDGS